MLWALSLSSHHHTPSTLLFGGRLESFYPSFTVIQFGYRVRHIVGMLGSLYGCKLSLSDFKRSSSLATRREPTSREKARGSGRFQPLASEHSRPQSIILHLDNRKSA